MDAYEPGRRALAWWPVRGPRILYGTHQDYVLKVRKDVRKLVDQRWLTSDDGAQLVSQAQAANVPG
jgi:hypothetical protein